jgi:hypothetical protein
VVVAATGADAHGGGPTADETSAPGQAGSAAGSTSTADPVARTLGGVGLVAGLGALVCALLAWRRSSESAAG